MLLVAIGFKLAVVPFHMWTPDVYQGAPAPIAAFVATVSKGAVVALLFRMFPHDQLTAWLYAAFVAAAVASMIAGNLLALMQQNVKRILGYSSIAHMGYLLVAFVAGGPSAADAAAFYLATYFVTTLGAFGVVTLISSPDGDAEALDNYRGLFWRRPLLAGVFALMVLSLAGLPLTAGFQGKFALIYAGVAGARWMPVIVLVCTSTVGLYYYLRIVAVLFARSPERSGTMRHLPLFGRLAVAGLTLAVLWLGILPGAVIDAIRAMM
jgi:NADH-quinone oxidoreductase subunit N